MTRIFDIERYPLHWPFDWPRTDKPQHSQFVTTYEKAHPYLMQELGRLKATEIIISTNMPLRKDGQLYANTRAPEDPGVAVYFQRDGRPFAIVCDRWKTVSDNMHAIAKMIEAMRGIERWGANGIHERVFTGFLALPGKVSGCSK